MAKSARLTVNHNHMAKNPGNFVLHLYFGPANLAKLQATGWSPSPRMPGISYSLEW